MEVKCWIAEVAEKSRLLLTDRRRIFAAPHFCLPRLHRRAERFLTRTAREISLALWTIQVPFSPPTSLCIGKEFPNGSVDAGPAVRGSAPGKWSARYHRQTFRRPVREYRPRDIGPPPGGREKRNNGPWEDSFWPSSNLVNGTQVPGTGQLALVRFMAKFGRGLTRKVFDHCFGGATPAKHSAVDRSIVAVISAHINSWAHAHGALRRVQRAWVLLRLSVKYFVAFQKPPRACYHAKPIFHLCNHEPA